MATKDLGPCKAPDCGQPSKWKGLCGKCYHQAKTLIDANETTWDELGELGLCSQEDKKLLTAFRKLKAAKQETT